jgi:hypothetical protein
VSQEIGKKNLTYREYDKAGKYSAGTIAVRLGSWHDALERAGLKSL